MSITSSIDPLLAEQADYYRAVAPEYESLSVPGGGGSEVAAALEAFAPAGEVLELACGPGMWTEILLRHATSVTAVDSAPEMLARARARVGEEENRVRFVQADLFSWRPERRRIVKVPYRPAELAQQLEALGWRLAVTQTSGAFYWGAGGRVGRG